MDSKTKKKANKPLMIIVVILFAILLIVLIATSGNDSSDNTTSNSIKTDYSYDNLQKVFLEITPDTTPNDVMGFAQQYNLSYSENIYRGSHSICYKLAYNDEVAKFKYPETGDYIEIDFNTDNSSLQTAEYFNADAFCYDYNEIYLALLYVSGTHWDFRSEGMDGDYVGYYGQTGSSEKDGIVIKYTNGNETKTNYYSFDSAKSIINCIIDNAEKYTSLDNK